MAVQVSRSLEVNPNWQELAETYLPEARKLAYYSMRHLSSQNALRDDIYSAAIKGLVDAARRYDDTRGASFWTYAEPKIHGTIVDCIRNSLPGGRYLASQCLRVEKATQSLTAALGKAPTEQQIARKLGWTLDKLWRVRERADQRAPVRLDYQNHSEDSDGEELYALIADPSATPEQRVLKEADKDQLHQGISQLPERWQAVLWLYYWEDWTFREIGTILGVGESRVSQIHVGAMKRLRQLIPER